MCEWRVRWKKKNKCWKPSISILLSKCTIWNKQVWIHCFCIELLTIEMALQCYCLYVCLCVHCGQKWMPYSMHKIDSFRFRFFYFSNDFYVIEQRKNGLKKAKGKTIEHLFWLLWVVHNSSTDWIKWFSNQFTIEPNLTTYMSVYGF